MKLLKWGLFFLLAFGISFILLRTFSQDVFKQTAQARIIGYLTPEIPIYFYVAGAFIIGLALGLIALGYNFVTSTTDILKKSKRIKELEKEVDFLSEQLSQVSPRDKSQLPLEETLEDTQFKYETKEDETKEEEDEDEESNEKDSKDNEIDNFIG